MTTDRIKKVLACSAAVVALAGCCIGCGNDSLGHTGRYTSYVATDSVVYSSTAELVRDVADSVVEIRTETVQTQWGMQYIVSGAGSGVIVAENDAHSSYYIITNNHVISGANDIHVTLRTGDTYDATLIATDVRGDIAVIAIHETQTLNIATWGNSDDLAIGEDLIAIGNPLGSLGGTVTKGILSATARSIAVGDNTMTLLQTDTAINPGNSGGGLFNMRGQLVGVVNAKTTDEEVEGICFAIPANTARAIYDDLVNYGAVQGRATLGIDVAMLSSGNVYVTSVANSAQGTFKLQDCIYKINGKEITSMLAYNDAIAAIKPGESVEITVYRGVTSIGHMFYYTDTVTFTVTAEQVK